MRAKFTPAVLPNDTFRRRWASSPASQEPGEVLVRMVAASICETDRRALLGTKSSSLGQAGEAIALGHEGGGRVADPGSLQHELAPGDMVVVLPHSTCERCDRCREGRPNLCPDLRHLGLHLGGTLAEWMAFPAQCVRRVPDHFPEEALPLAEPLSCVIRGFDQVRDAFTRLARQDAQPRLTVLGAGPMGSLIALRGKRLWPRLRVTMADPNEERRRVARRLGIADEVVAAPPPDLQSPLTFVASSAAQAARDAVACTRAGGTVELFAGINQSDLADEDPARRAQAALWEGVHRAERREAFPAPAGPVRLVGTSGYTPETVQRSIEELCRHYHHYALVQNVVIHGLLAGEAHYRWPDPHTVTFPGRAVEAFLAPGGVNDPRHGQEVSGCLKPLIKL
jgi:threonine dehydrogenase-like Zn-dependent dehydrogenase